MDEAQYGGLIDKYYFLDIFKVIGSIWLLLYPIISYFVYIQQGARFLSSPMIMILILDILGLYAYFNLMINQD